VPNHIAADYATASGPIRPHSARAGFFDIDPATASWRRFFDNHLTSAAVAPEGSDPALSRPTSLWVSLVRERAWCDGLRVPIPPKRALRRPGRVIWTRLRGRGACAGWVEKILGSDERLRREGARQREGRLPSFSLDDVCGVVFVRSGRGRRRLTACGKRGPGRPARSVLTRWRLERPSSSKIFTGACRSGSSERFGARARPGYGSGVEPEVFWRRAVASAACCPHVKRPRPATGRVFPRRRPGGDCLGHKDRPPCRTR